MAGRPRRKLGDVQRQRAVNAADEEFEAFRDRALKEGYLSAADKLGEFVRGLQVDRTELPMTAQERFDTALRQHKRKLDIEFQQRVLEEVRRRIDQIVLPHWKQKIDEAHELYRRRKGAMDKATFNAIRRALHPDSRRSISEATLAAAFDTFMRLEKFLLDEKDSPTAIGDLPRTWEEWESAKRAATAARRAGRTTMAKV